MRLRGAGPAGLRARLDAARQNAKLLTRLEAISTAAASRLTSHKEFTFADDAFAKAFKEAGLGEAAVDPAALTAAKVSASDIQPALVTALYRWNLLATDRNRAWVQAVLRGADPVSEVWRARAEDPDAMREQAAVSAAAADPTLAAQPPGLLLFVHGQAHNAGLDTRPLLLRIRQAHPTDY